MPINSHAMPSKARQKAKARLGVLKNNYPRPGRRGFSFGKDIIETNTFEYIWSLLNPQGEYKRRRQACNRDLSNFPEVLPYFHRTYPVLSSSITSGLHSVHSHYEPYTNTQLAALDIIDESDQEEREARGKKVDEIVKLYRSRRHLSGERNHKRACKILRLYCQGLTEDEISDKLKISQPTVHLHLARAIERLKAITKRLYNRRASPTNAVGG